MTKTEQEEGTREEPGPWGSGWGRHPKKDVFLF